MRLKFFWRDSAIIKVGDPNLGYFQFVPYWLIVSIGNPSPATNHMSQERLKLSHGQSFSYT